MQYWWLALLAIFGAPPPERFELTLYFPGAQYEEGRRSIIAFGPEYPTKRDCLAARERVAPRLAPGVRLRCDPIETARLDTKTK